MNRSIFFAASFTLFSVAHLIAADPQNINTQEVSRIALNATYKVITAFPTAYKVTVTLNNNAGVTANSWTSTFTMPEGCSLGSNLSGGSFVVNGQNVTVTSLPTAAGIHPGRSTSFQMIINRPSSGLTEISNLQATADGTLIMPPNLQIPPAPILNPIVRTTPNSYTISWNNASGAMSFILEQDTSSNFPNPTVVVQERVLSKTITDVANGTYFYRVSATNPSGTSPSSNIQSFSSFPLNNATPILNPITPHSSRCFTVSWESLAEATSYTLEKDISSDFSNPFVVAQGNILSKKCQKMTDGTYYYRVSASNAISSSTFSNVQSITMPHTPPPVAASIEHSAWYIDWTSSFTGPTFVLPSGVNLLNIFVGELMFDSDGRPTLGGFGNMTLPQLDAFTTYCSAQVPPVAVKVSIGGSGGMYDRCWDLLTTENVPGFAQGMADFCHAHGLAGVDFDYESYVSSEQAILVGTLIKKFKAIDPNLQTSLCTNAGFGPDFPWQNTIARILSAASHKSGNCSVDRLYIMSYYNSLEQEQNWIAGPDGNGGWANWLTTSFGFTPERVTVGIGDYHIHAYDPAALAAWAASKGFSTAHWAFDPAQP